MNFYPFHIGDYASATAHLSIVEDGVYRRLLDVYYVREAPIPLDLRQAFRLVRAQTEIEREAVETILREFFTETEDGWRHARCEAEIERAIEKRGKAKASAEAKWSAPQDLSMVNAKKRSERLALARQKATHTEREWGAILSICGFKCVSCGADKGIVKDHILPIYQGGSDGIENLQPLCRSCNSRKGPDSADLRPHDWRERLQSVCETSAIAGIHQASAVDDACGTTAPNPNPNPKEENTPLPPASGGRDRPGRATTSDGFEQFWAAYPKRVSKGAARKAWAKLKPSEQLLQAILAGIGRAKTSAQWLRDDGRFVPHPATWLNAEGWLDDPPTGGGKSDDQWWLGRGFGTRESAIAAGAREPA